LPFSIATAPAPADYDSKDFQSFYPYPGSHGNVLTQVSTSGTAPAFSEPFAGSPTVTQVAAASSAAGGWASGSVPSSLYQAFSRQEYMIDQQPPAKRELFKRELQKLVNAIYTNSIFDGLAVCTQWPSSCKETDGRLIDGGFADGPSLALNVAQYQQQHSALDLSHTLKLVVTYTDAATDVPNTFLSYFATDFNAGIDPGAFVWAPATGLNGVAQPVPWRSTQIFDKQLTLNDLKSLEQPLSDSNLTYALLDAVTIQNDAFGVQAGQKAEILVLFTNSIVPTSILGVSATEQWTQPLADMAHQISASQDLLALVQAFVAGDTRRLKNAARRLRGGKAIY
jgi:hypothetical protein